MNILSLEQSIDDIMTQIGKEMVNHFESLLKRIDPLEVQNCHIVTYAGKPFYHELWLRDVKLGSFEIKVNYGV